MSAGASLFATFANFTGAAKIDRSKAERIMVLAEEKVHDYNLQNPRATFLQLMSDNSVASWVREQGDKDIFMVTSIVYAKKLTLLCTSTKGYEAAIEGGADVAKIKAFLAKSKDVFWSRTGEPNGQDEPWPALGFRTVKIPKDFIFTLMGDDGTETNTMEPIAKRLRGSSSGQTGKRKSENGGQDGEDWITTDYGALGVNLKADLLAGESCD
jgi:hypothetical protein